MKHALRSGIAFHYTEMSQNNNSHELRCAVRFPLSLPMVVVVGGKELQAITCNVSASGVLFETVEELSVGEMIQFSFQMPGAVLGSARDILVECRGRVVRCSISSSQPLIAATIDDYRFVEQ
jgi:hypothetical protein